MTGGHVFIFKSVKKAKVVLRQCCIMFFLLANRQGVSLATHTNTNLHVSPAANTLSRCTLTFVLQQLYQQHRAKPHSHLRVFRPAPSQSDSSALCTLGSLPPASTSCTYKCSINSLKLLSEDWPQKTKVWANLEQDLCLSWPGTRNLETLANHS